MALKVVVTVRLRRKINTLGENEREKNNNNNKHVKERDQRRERKAVPCSE